MEEQRIKIKINNFNYEHFLRLGYDLEKNKYLDIMVEELPHGSSIKINVTCSYCGKIFKKEYRKFLLTKNDVCCKECSKYKMMKTSLEKYGNVCSLRNEEVLKKSKETNLKNIGVEYPFQNKEILEKCRNTCIEKYGENYRQCIISKQQRYLCQLFGGILNYSEYPYLLDVFFKNYNIYLEYDGSGHELSIKLGEKTKKEFDNKEKEREYFLKQKGYKCFRIISNTDKLPKDEELIRIKERAFYMLLINNYSKYIYNIDTKIESFEK